jgi:LDH2 family malate/lactate/ureidoglycolate dehydrogenase
MAAWGGTIPLFGTNPISVAIPTGLTIDIVLDMASSVVARGKIRYAASQKQPIPEGWALNTVGDPTTDPQEAIRGTLLPIGGPKGYGLALVVDILAGVLTGAAYGPNIVSLHEMTQDVASGLILQAIDISAFEQPDEFKKRIQDLIMKIRNSPRSHGIERIYLPGEIEFLTKQERLESGIPIPENLIQELDRLAVELGTELDWEVGD